MYGVSETQAAMWPGKTAVFIKIEEYLFHQMHMRQTTEKRSSSCVDTL